MAATVAIEAKAMAEYKRLVGRLVLVHTVSGFVDGADTVNIALDPPAVVRVLRTPREAVERTMDGGWCDPNYDVELAVPHPQLRDVTSLWVYGTSFREDGREEPGDIVGPAGPRFRLRALLHRGVR